MGDEEYASQVVDAYLTEVNLLDSRNPTKAWYLDSGASNHVTGDSSVFSSISPSSGTKIISAGGQSHDVTGVSNVAIRLPTRKIQKISHVLYSPSITKNLISVGFLVDKGFSLEFMRNKCIITDSEGWFVGSAYRSPINGLYKLKGHTLVGSHEITNSTSQAHLVHLHDSSKADLWHKRLGHYHLQGMRRMMQYGAVRGLPNIPITNSPCSSCISGKQSRKSIPKTKSTMSTSLLQLVYSDVAGLFRVRSLGGVRYFLIFIDDYSKRTWVYLLSSKDQVLEKFKIFHQEVEHISGKKIDTLRSDNAGEYTSKAFSSYCQSFGILRQLSQPYTPQHNGIAERKNRSIIDIVRCLLANTQVPGHLWIEAVRATCILLNLRPSKSQPDKSPDELFSGKKPCISHFRTFGSLAFVHQSKPNRYKFASRATPHIYLSHGDKSKAY